MGGSSTVVGGATFAGNTSGIGTTTTVGTTNSGGTGGTGGASIPSSSNVLGGFMVNPLSMGLSMGAKGTFNQPLYAINATQSTARVTGRANTGLNNTKSVAFNTFGQDRNIPFITDLSRNLPMPNLSVERLQADVQNIIARSSALPSRDTIQATVEGGVVVLRGEASSARECLLAESIIRLSPGVRDVRNEIKVAENP
jgi:hypothetical protein